MVNDGPTERTWVKSKNNGFMTIHGNTIFWNKVLIITTSIGQNLKSVKLDNKNS